MAAGGVCPHGFCTAVVVVVQHPGTPPPVCRISVWESMTMPEGSPCCLKWYDKRVTRFKDIRQANPDRAEACRTRRGQHPRHCQSSWAYTQQSNTEMYPHVMMGGLLNMSVSNGVIRCEWKLQHRTNTTGAYIECDRGVTTRSEPDHPNNSMGTQKYRRGCRALCFQTTWANIDIAAWASA